MDIFKYVRCNLDVSCLTLAFWHKQLSEEPSAARVKSLVSESVMWEQLQASADTSMQLWTQEMQPYCPLETEMRTSGQKKTMHSEALLFLSQLIFAHKR